MSTNRSLMTRRVAVALLVLRIALGVIMIAHGYQKMFTLGVGGVAAGFAKMGVPLPGVTAPLVAIVELVGGVAVLVGFLTRLAALGFAIDMLGAIAFVHFKNGFFLPKGFEYPLVLLLLSITLILAGAGRFSLDALTRRRRAAGTDAG